MLGGREEDPEGRGSTGVVRRDGSGSSAIDCTVQSSLSVSDRESSVEDLVPTAATWGTRVVWRSHGLTNHARWSYLFSEYSHVGFSILVL
jgi:hypothetical protein